MIPVPLPKEEAILSRRVCKLLKKRQNKVVTLPAAKIDIDWKGFRQTIAGDHVATALSRVFHGKCAYCEQESAKDIEHFEPKSRTPAKMYSWVNFLWCCRNCNTEKLAAFPVDGSGNPVLLNPTLDEPLDYFCWDELSGKMIPHPDADRQFRAIQTRDCFGLDQFSLSEERRNKLGNILYLLARLIEESPMQPATWERLRDELAANRPWLGIVRQLFRSTNSKYVPLVRIALQKSPELHNLVAHWLP